jgi:hypothetical protein
MRTRFWSESLNERDHSEKLGEVGKIILKMILRENFWNIVLDSSVLGHGPVASMVNSRLTT